MQDRDVHEAPALMRLVLRLTRVRADEFTLVAWSCVYFFFVLSSYYCIRPVRDAFGIAGTDQELRWLFRTTLVVMVLMNPVFSVLVSRYPRRVFIPVVYLFFALNLLFFYILFRLAPDGNAVATRRVFYVWVSVFNLFVVSVFWAFMADLYRTEQSKRLYGLVGVGGTVGAIAGASLPWLLAERIGAVNMLPISTGLLLIACLCMLRLNRIMRERQAARTEAGQPALQEEQVIRGSAWAGIVHVFRSPYLIGISLYILLYTLSSTILYFMQADIIRQAFDSRAERTAFFAQVDVFTNAATLFIQLFLTGRIIRMLGVGLTLALLPCVVVFGFTALMVAPTLAVIVAFQVCRRGANYALARPARESLFTVVPREEKYKAKSFIDTFVYRGGDAIGTTGVAFLAVPLGVAWLILSLLLGRAQQKLAATPLALRKRA